MNDIFAQILELIAAGEIRISAHGYDEMAADNILVQDILAGVLAGKVIESYPDYHKGPCLLVLQQDQDNGPLHVVWGIPRGTATPAVLVTAYRPDPRRWSNDFMRRLI